MTDLDMDYDDIDEYIENIDNLDAHMNDLVDELRKYADIEGSELGEYWRSLCYLHDHNGFYYRDQQFESVFIKKLIETLKDIKSSFEIATETKTITQTRTITYLKEKT